LANLVWQGSNLR